MNKYELSAPLKAFAISFCLTVMSRLFHNFGPDTEKALSPYTHLFLAYQGAIYLRSEVVGLGGTAWGGTPNTLAPHHENTYTLTWGFYTQFENLRATSAYPSNGVLCDKISKLAWLHCWDQDLKITTSTCICCFPGTCSKCIGGPYSDEPISVDQFKADVCDFTKIGYGK